MASRCVGITVSGKKITLVDAEVPDTGPITLISDQSWNLQDGEKANAYSIMYQQVLDFLTENSVDLTVIKGSALTTGSVRMAHLEAAELRGIVIAAAASAAKTQILSKALISRTFGKRKVDDYVKDNTFWSVEFIGVPLRVGSREAAMVLLAARKAN